MPDIYGSKKKKTTVDGDGIIVDSNGVAIRAAVDGDVADEERSSEISASGGAAAQNANATMPENNTSDSNKIVVEEDYADEWDD